MIIFIKMIILKQNTQKTEILGGKGGLKYFVVLLGPA